MDPIKETKINVSPSRQHEDDDFQPSQNQLNATTTPMSPSNADRDLGSIIQLPKTTPITQGEFKKTINPVNPATIKTTTIPIVHDAANINDNVENNFRESSDDDDNTQEFSNNNNLEISNNNILPEISNDQSAINNNGQAVTGKYYVPYKMLYRRDDNIYVECTVQGRDQNSGLVKITLDN